jgi:hypothetical protein
VNLLKRAIITTAGAALAAGLMAGAANASTNGFPPPPGPATAVTYVVTPNVLGNGGPWASSQVWRTATVTLAYAPAPPWLCGWTPGSPPISCFAFTATLRDWGTFRTIRFALTPNQSFFYYGRHIRSVVSGSVHGSATFGIFYATALPNPLAVPHFYFDKTGGLAAISWPNLFFPAPAQTFGVSPSSWKWTYSAWTRCGFQSWTTSSTNNHGNSFFAGNITGCHLFHHHWTA